MTNSKYNKFWQQYKDTFDLDPSQLMIFTWVQKKSVFFLT